MRQGHSDGLVQVLVEGGSDHGQPDDVVYDGLGSADGDHVIDELGLVAEVEHGGVEPGHDVGGEVVEGGHHMVGCEPHQNSHHAGDYV